MEYENMRMPELKSLARDRGLRNYSRMRKTELVALYRYKDIRDISIYKRYIHHS